MTEATAPRQFESKTFRSLRHSDPQFVQTAIRAALHLAGHAELRRVQVEFDGDAITTSGRVPTFYLKQLAQNIALNVPGIERIHNELQVC